MQLLKLFSIVRGDLSRSQKGVQAGHAVAQLLLFGDKQSWDNGTLVYLKAPDETSLQERYEQLVGLGYEVHKFYEPDIGNQLTAIAALGIDEHVKDLPLL